MNFEHAKNLSGKWNDLGRKWFAHKSENSIWMFNRPADPRDPEEGWKLHISATVLNATDILEKIAPFLKETNVLFKAPISLYELQKINCGLFYGFSQVGKFMSIYPRTVEEAIMIAKNLYSLTYHFESPTVPFDKKFKDSRCVHYRYGSFSLIIQNKDGSITPAIRDESGELVHDKRAPGSAVPSWLEDPFIENEQSASTQKSSSTNYIRAYEAISQRGKGGVYLAIDLSCTPARKCILKEGRKNGETEWDGRDGYWRIQHEANILKEFASQGGIQAAELYSTFEIDNNIYILLEYIEGEDLNSIINKNLKPKDYLRYGMQVAEIMRSIHATGWLWRDCKPTNLIVTRNGLLRPVDFEGACRIEDIGESPWGTPGFYTEEKPVSVNNMISQDLYALGATLHHIISGRPPLTTKLMPISKFRRNVPESIQKLISKLTNKNQDERPSAETVYQIFNLEYNKISR